MVNSVIDKTKLYSQAWAQYGASKQIVVAMEECAELTKELSKMLRGKENLRAVAEEMADVEIMLEQIKQHFSCACIVEGYKEYKIQRLNERLNNAKEQ